MSKAMNSELREVQEVETCFVPPSGETPKQGLWLSALDLVWANRGHIPTVYFYRRNDAGVAAQDFFDIGRLKKAMAKALVAFYPLAGRLAVDCNGRPEIDCNAEGALFVVARSELTVDDFSDLRPSPELRRLLIPRIEPPSIVLAIQVTLLRCGGVALGTALHHTAIDALSTFHFFHTWSTFCRDGDAAVTELPCHDRTLLRARSRSPPIANADDAVASLSPKLKLCEGSGPITPEIFAISKDQLAALKRICGGASTFAAVAALVWQCTCTVRRLPPDATARVTFPVNIRRRVTPPLPDRYFGNALVFLFATAAVGDIVSGTLAAVAARIKCVIDRIDDKLIRSVVGNDERPWMSNRPAKGSLHDTELRMVSWLGMPVYDADFGWGKPQVMSLAELLHGGFVYMMDGMENDGGVRVFMSMETAKVEEFGRLFYAKLEPVSRSNLLQASNCNQIRVRVLLSNN